MVDLGLWPQWQEWQAVCSLEFRPAKQTKVIYKWSCSSRWLLSDNLLPTKVSATSPNRAPRRTDAKTHDPMGGRFPWEPWLNTAAPCRSCVLIHQVSGVVRHLILWDTEKEKRLFCQKIYISSWSCRCGLTLSIFQSDGHGRKSVGQGAESPGPGLSFCSGFIPSSKCWCSVLIQSCNVWVFWTYFPTNYMSGIHIFKLTYSLLVFKLSWLSCGGKYLHFEALWSQYV